MSSATARRTYVIDTSVLLSDPHALRRFAEHDIVLGVSGGVAAYKAALLLRALTEAGHDVRVVPTPSALHFVGAATFEALVGFQLTDEQLQYNATR